MFKIIATIVITGLIGFFIPNAQATTPVYNQIAMSYATMNITQMVVANAAMRAGGNFSLSVQAVDGGGRGPPNYPNDIANLQIVFYNYSNGVIGTATSNNTTVFNTWNTYTVNSTNCGGASCSQLAYFVVYFVGNDGGYWAGNAGTNWRQPSLTFTPTAQTTASTVNILYNPEFGVNGTYTSTSAPSGWSQNTGGWGGNTHPQVLNFSGTVNAAGGGYFSAANTGSGKAGGYAQLTTSIANQNIAGGGSSTVWLYQGNMSATQWYNTTLYIGAGWTWSCSTCTVTSGSVTNGVNSSGIYQITIVNGSGAAVTPNSGQVYTFYPPGYVPAVTVVSTTNTTTTTTSVSGTVTSTYSQPVTITTYSDGSQTTTNNGSATLISTTDTGGTSGITTSQTSQVTSVASRMSSINANSVYVNQSGSGDNINITQVGRGNKIDGADSTGGFVTAASITGGNNTIKIRQGDPIANTGNNLIDLTAVGGGNTLNLNQGVDQNGNATGSDQGGHYQYDYVNGTGNNITVVQENTASGAGHFSSLSVVGNLNTVGITQTGNAQKQLFATVTGNSNTVTASQTGTSSAYLSVTATGNGNSAVVNQTNTGASGANSATIVLQNNGAPASVNLTQTGGQNYSITQSCVTACGTVIVRQGN
jgi:hypothetical protein